MNVSGLLHLGHSHIWHLCLDWQTMYKSWESRGYEVGSEFPCDKQLPSMD